MQITAGYMAGGRISHLHNETSLILFLLIVTLLSISLTILYFESFYEQIPFIAVSSSYLLTSTARSFSFLVFLISGTLRMLVYYLGSFFFFTLSSSFLIMHYFNVRVLGVWSLLIFSGAGSRCASNALVIVVLGELGSLYLCALSWLLLSTFV